MILLFLRGMNQRIHFRATKKNLPSQFISTSSSISIALFSCAWHYLFLQANMIQLGSSINCFSFAVTADFVHGLQTFASNCIVMMEKASIRPPCLQGVSSVLAQRIGSVKSREDWVWNRMANEKPEFFRQENRANQSSGRHIFRLPAFKMVLSFTRPCTTYRLVHM